MKTLLEAILLVFLVMYLFLQNFPRHPDPDHRRAGGADGHFRGAVCLWLQHQHP